MKPRSYSEEDFFRADGVGQAWIGRRRQGLHKAELRSVGPVLYANTGDWVESCSALAEREDGTLTLLLTSATRVHRPEAAPVRP